MSEVRGTHEVDTKFLDRLLMTRISRRVLAEQHIALHKGLAAVRFDQTDAHRKGYIGVICLECKLQDVVHRCYDKASVRTYKPADFGDCPTAFGLLFWLNE